MSIGIWQIAIVVILVVLLFGRGKISSLMGDVAKGIKTIKDFFGKLIDWKKLDDLIPKNFKKGTNYKRTGRAGIFAGSLELVKEGNLKIKQEKLFDDVYIKENK